MFTVVCPIRCRGASLSKYGRRQKRDASTRPKIHGAFTRPGGHIRVLAEGRSGSLSVGRPVAWSPLPSRRFDFAFP